MYNFILGYFGGSGERHKENYTYVLWFKSWGYCSKLSPVNDYFSECYFFFILQCFWCLKKQYFHLFTLTHNPSVQWLVLVRWCYWDSGWTIQQFIFTSLCPHSLKCSATDQPSTCTCLNLHLNIYSLFLLDFKIKMSLWYRLHGSGFLLIIEKFSSPMSHLQNTSVPGYPFTLTSEFTCYSSIWVFGLTGSLESDLSNRQNG